MLATRNPDGSVTYEAEELPFYYTSTGQFLGTDGQPSGAAGAEAAVQINLNNYPQVIYGVRIRNSLEIAQEVIDANPGLLATIRDLHDEQKVRIDLAQQNIVTQALRQDLLQGARGINFHPFPVPYLMRGGNNVRIAIRRLVPYPTITVSEEEFPLLPTAEVVLVCGVLVADQFPAAGPPSTGAEDPRRRG